MTKRPVARVRAVRACALLVAGTIAGSAAPATAQDYANVTVTAPSLGSFPRLVAGTVEIVNDGSLTVRTTSDGGTQKTVAIGSNAPPQVHMVLPWGGEAAQFISALASGTMAPITQITCEFMHSGSSQPYYTVIIDRPIISKIVLSYDSSATAASPPTEDISMEAPQLEYPDMSTSTTSASVAATPAGRAPVRMTGRAMTQPRLQMVATPAVLRQLVSRVGSVAAGVPVAGFAGFTTIGSAAPNFVPEGGLPAWAPGAMTNLEALTVTFTRHVITHTLASAGVSVAEPVPGPMSPATAAFTKGVGALTTQIQAAMAGAKQVTATLQLADAPGRLGYRIQFAKSVIASDHMVLSNGHTSEQTSVSSLGPVTVTDVRRNLTATAQ